MKHKLNFSLAMFGLVLAYSCGGTNSSGNHKNPGTINKFSQESSPAPLVHFENWKKKLIKGCNLQDVFNADEDLNSDLPKGLDLNLLMLQNNHPAIWNIGQDSLLISKTESLGGNGQSEIKTPSFEASIKRQGGSCVISINQQEVYRTMLAKKITIAAHWGKLAENFKSVDAGIINALETNDSTIPLLAKKLSISKDDSTKFLAVENILPRYLVRPINQTTFEVLMPLPQKVGNLSFLFRLNQDLNNSSDLIGFQGVAPFNSNESLSCLKQTNLERVSFQEMTKGCEILYPDLLQLTQAQRILQELAIKYFKLNKPHPESFTAFKDILKPLILNQLIDPTEQSEVIKKVILGLQSIKHLINEHPSLITLEKSLMNIGYEWSLYGPGEIDADLSVLLNVAVEMYDPFTNSLTSIVNKLYQNPTSFTAIRALNYAHSISNKSEFKTTALKAIQLAQQKHDPSIEKKLDQVFQKEVTLEQMKSWIKLLER